MSTDPKTAPILVTGGTGRQGGTGRVVVERLVEGGRRVRALVRTLDERADVLEKMGAEVVVGDFTNYGGGAKQLNQPTPS